MTVKQNSSVLYFHMPAEWEVHDATWLAWPYDELTFPQLEKVEQSFVLMIKHLLSGERVDLLVKDERMQKHVRTLLLQAEVPLNNLRFHLVEYMDVWIRDYGPIFVKSKTEKQLAITKWRFNAWGNKYPELLSDNAIPEMINTDLRLPYFESGIILEGGSIEVNGNGTLLTTEQCLLNKNRNADLTKEQIEQKLKDYLGVSQIIWLKDGLEGDDTDGHIDDIARFVSPTTVLYAYEENKQDENCQRLQENYEILSQAVDQDGQKLKLVKLPMPQPIEDGDRRLPASYANFYIGNTTILCPTFQQASDAEAIAVLKSVFPERNVVGIAATDFVYGNGAFHCASQQQPRS